MKVEAAIFRDHFRVGEPCAVETAVTVDRELGPGAQIEFQFPNTWSLVTGPSYTRELQSTDPLKEHFLSVTAPGTEAGFQLAIRERQLNYPEGQARHGRHVVATLRHGTVPAGQRISIRYENTFAPYVAEVESVWLRVNGQAPPSAPRLTVLPGAHQVLRVIAPSGVEPGETFDVLVVSLDRFDNASSTTFEDERLSWSSDGAPDRAEGQVDAIDFCGSIRIPVRLEREGIYRFRMRDAVSNAVRVAPGAHGPYWGDLHIHTKLSHDGQGTDPYHYAREVSGLDFAATADHVESLGPEGYGILESWAEEANQEQGFVTLLADERNPRALTGHHNIYFRDRRAFHECRALDRDGAVDPAQEAHQFQELDPARAMLVPHHTGISFGNLPVHGRGNAVEWDAWEDRGLRPLVEIYSHHGQSEVYQPQYILAYEFNRMRNPERRANTSVPGPYYAQDYWMSGQRPGVIGSSDEHSGQGGRRHGGIAAVWASALGREAIFDALRQRCCYATTGERILVDLSVDGVGMGATAQRRKGSTLQIWLGVWGTALLLRVELLRFRFGVDDRFQPILARAPRPESMDATYELEDTYKAPCMYYARLTQEPLEWPAMAWTSPVWIDEMEGENGTL